MNGEGLYGLCGFAQVTYEEEIRQHFCEGHLQVPHWDVMNDELLCEVAMTT